MTLCDICKHPLIAHYSSGGKCSFCGCKGVSVTTGKEAQHG